MGYGKVVELFLVNGTADSLVTAELSNWNGQAIKIPRIEVQTCTLPELTQAGVYFLFCKEEDDTESVYIGESENVKERLLQHMRDFQTDKEKFYWTTAVVFVGRDLNKALIRYLENRLVGITLKCKRDKVLTKATYQNTVLKNSEKAVMEEFIDDIKIVINALGYKVLEPLVHHNATDEDLLSFEIGEAKAKGKVTTEGFVVLQGAKMNAVTNKSLAPALISRREEHIADGKVKDFVTTEDLLFSSSSAAADFILGYSASGPQTWKDKNGRTLKELDEEKNKLG